MASTRLMEILASLARRRALRTLHTICETQHQISTRKLEQYLEPIGDELAGYAFNLRMEYDALSAKLAALESQQAASVGGEREVCAEWIEQHYGFPACQLCLLNGKDLERAFSGGWQASAALSPAGGGTVPELSQEDGLNVALVLSHAQELREQGHPARADALVQATEEYVSILAEVQAAQNGIRARAGEL